MLCYVSADGYYDHGNVMNAVSGRNARIEIHPDTGAVLKGRVPLWDDMSEAVRDFCARFPQLRYLGFDFVATDKGQVKMLEINSLTSLDCLQLEGPASTLPGGDWFDAKRAEVRQKR